MAERNPPILSRADDLVVPAPTRKDGADTSEGDDAIEIHYRPEEGFAGDSVEAEIQTGDRGLEGDENEVKREELAVPARGESGARRRRRREQPPSGSQERRRVAVAEPPRRRQVGRTNPPAQREVRQDDHLAQQQPPPIPPRAASHGEGEEPSSSLAEDRRRRGPRSTSPTYPCSRRRGPSRERELIEFFGYLEGLPDDLRNRAICDFYGVEPDPEYPEWPGWIVDIMEAGVWNPGKGARK